MAFDRYKTLDTLIAGTDTMTPDKLGSALTLAYNGSVLEVIDIRPDGVVTLKFMGLEELQFRELLAARLPMQQ